MLVQLKATSSTGKTENTDAEDFYKKNGGRSCGNASAGHGHSDVGRHLTEHGAVAICSILRLFPTFTNAII